MVSKIGYLLNFSQNPQASKLIKNSFIILEIRISFRGEAYVDWPSSSNPNDKTSGPKKGGFRLPTDDHYSASEEYFNRTIPLFGKGIEYYPLKSHCNYTW